MAERALEGSTTKLERVCAASSDPWRYRTSAYDRLKYADTLAALPARPLGHVLEVGCSIGVFTEQLAERCERVLGLDFSARAIELADERVGCLANVELCRARFPEQTPDGPWDLIVCSEVLYYLDRESLTRAIDWIVRKLRGGASAVVVSWRGEGVDEPFRGDDVHDLLARELARWHTLDRRRTGYRLDRFDGRCRLRPSSER